MNKNIKKGILKVTLVILCLVAFQFFWEKYYTSLEKRYVVGKVLQIHPLLRQGVQVKYQFSIYGTHYTKSFPRENFSPKVGQCYIVEVPIKNRDNSKILFDHPVLDTLTSPWEGWEEIPEFLRKK